MVHERQAKFREAIESCRRHGAGADYGICTGGQGVGKRQITGHKAARRGGESHRAGDLEALTAEAVRCFQAGMLDEAATRFLGVIALRPGDPTAHNNLGAVMMAKSQTREAAKRFRRALALDPRHVSAHANLAVVLSHEGEFAEARDHFQRALELDPTNADVRIGLGKALGALGETELAAAQFERVLAARPDHAEALLRMGTIRRDQGRFEEAKGYYERVIALAPEHPEAHFSLAMIRKHRPGDAALASLEALAAKDGLPAPQAAFAHFALGKALDECGEYERAFRHFRKGNEFRRRQTNYDEAAQARLYRGIAEVFDAELLERARGEGDPSDAPVFVVGMPRGGSSLIEQILASHPRVHGAGELATLEKVVEEVSGANSSRPFPQSMGELSGAALRRIGRDYVNGLTAVAGGKIRIVDKQPGNFARIGLIHMALPNARIIHTVRDARDTCVSCYATLFSKVDFSYDLAELGRYYRMYSDLMAHWRRVLPPDAILDVAYEDVVEDLEGQARRMIEYCGLEWDARCLDFHRTERTVQTASAAQVRQPLFRSSVQRWRRYEASLGPLLQELGFEPQLKTVALKPGLQRRAETLAA